MSRSIGYGTALLIMGSAVLGAVAIVLVPALFEEFRTGRLIAVLALLASAVAFGVVAKRNRQHMAE